MSDPVKLVAPTSPIKCLLSLPNDRAIQYKLGPERLTRLRNLNVLRLPVTRVIQTLGSTVLGTFQKHFHNLKNALKKDAHFY